jgi:AP-1 complex subunit gamma-1
VLSNFIKIVAAATDLHAYTVYKLFHSLKQDLSQESLVLAGLWIVGEYGEVLRTGGSSAGRKLSIGGEDDGENAGDEQMKDVADHEIIDLMEKILESPYNSVVVTEYVLAALVKLAARLRSPEALERTKTILRRFTSNIDLEIQQRSVEFTTLLTDPSLASVRAAVLERMPVPPPAVSAKARTAVSTSPSPVQNASGVSAAKSNATGGGLLDDLLGLDAGVKQSAGVSAAGSLAGQLGGLSLTSPNAAAAGGAMNVLADVFGTGAPAAKTKNDILSLFGTASPPAAQQTSRVSPTASSGLDLLGGLGMGTGAGMAALGALSPSPSAAAPAAFMQSADTPVYEKNGLGISFRQVGTEPGPDVQSRVCVIAISFKNNGPVPISDLNFQVAVPKTLKLQLMPPSSTVVPPGGSASQSMKILNPVGQTIEGQAVPLRLRLKIAFTAGLTKIDEISEFNGFGPAWKW